MLHFLKQVTVEPVLFLFMMALFIQIPITQMLILSKVCLAQHSQNICDNLHLKEHEDIENDIQTKASYWILYLQLFGALPGAVMSLIFGASSDKIGRKVIMVLPIMGSVINGIILILSAYYTHLALEYLIIGALAVGFAGNFGTFYVAVISYIADITTQESRTKRLGILESMVFIGGTLGLLLTGIMLQIAGIAAVYIIVVILNVIIVIYIGYWLEESLPASRREAHTSKDKPVSCVWSLWDTIWCALTVYLKPRQGNKRKYLLLLQCMTILGVLCMAGEMDLTVLYTKHQPLSWTPTLMGAYLALKNICKGVVLIVGLPIYFYIRGKKEPQRDIILGQVGQVSAILSFVMIANASTTLLMFTVPFIGSLAGLSGAVMGSIKTQLVQTTEFGAMFACSSFLDTMCSLLGSVLFNSLYPATLSFWPGLSFMVMASLALTSLFILTYIKYDMNSHPLITPLGNADQVATLLNDESDEEEINESLKMDQMHNWGRDKTRQEEIIGTTQI